LAPTTLGTNPDGRWLSRALFPAAVLALGAWALRAPSVDLAGALGLPGALNPSLVLLATLVPCYAGIAWLERRMPYRAEWNRPQRDLRADVLHLLFTGQGATALFQATVAVAALSGAAELRARLGYAPWPQQWPALAQLALALCVAEFGHYWFHRLSHEWSLLWRLHAVHHSAPRLYWLNATRFHPLDLFALLCVESGPLLLLGIGPDAFLSFLIFRAVYGQIQHCNIALASPGWLNRVLSSHELHRWHHSTLPAEGNRNYGAALSIWDTLFGSYFLPRDRRFEGPVGIGALPDFPQSYAAQLAAPFRWARIRNARRD
jgi:sterol desaturase/sphingolipid hydroxylase (fatty acid hydroxylase superfamily)